MQNRPENSRRKVLPRWRDFQSTPQFEIASVNAHRSPILGCVDEEFHIARQKFLNAPSIISAVELLDYRHAFSDDAMELASQYIEKSDAASRSVKRRFERNPESVNPKMGGTEIFTADDYIDQVRGKIRQKKIDLSNNPRSSISHADIALFYTYLGEIEKAKRHFDVAQNISPNNRFIVRSFIRFLNHVDFSEEAFDRFKHLKQSNDPWILSALVSSAHIAERVGELRIRRIRSVLEAGVEPIHNSELAAALATLELEAGGVKQAKRLFGRSGIAPTENAHTQIVWANINYGLGLETHSAPATSPFEAIALTALEQNSWDVFLPACRSWLQSEAFSSRAAVQGSFAASTFFIMPDHAVDFAKRGLLANPHDDTLQNNLAFAYAQLGKRELAAKTLSRAMSNVDGRSNLAMMIATSGFINVTMGDINGGIRDYNKAITIFIDEKDNDSTQRAILYMAKAFKDKFSLDIFDIQPEFRKFLENKKMSKTNKKIFQSFGLSDDARIFAHGEDQKFEIQEDIKDAFKLF